MVAEAVTPPGAYRDAVLEELAQYEAMEVPAGTYQAIAKKLGTTRQNVIRIAGSHGYRPARAEPPPPRQERASRLPRGTIRDVATDDPTVIQVYRYALRPSAEQVRVFEQHALAARICYNELLREITQNLDLIRWEERVLGQRISEYVRWGQIDLQNLWNRDVRYRRLPNYAELAPDDAYRSAFYEALPRALRAWRERRSQGFGFPRRRGRRWNPSITYYKRGEGAKPRISGHNHEHIELPRVPGAIRLEEHPRAALQPGTVIKRVTIRRDRRGRWFASIVVHRPPKQRSGHALQRGTIVGLAPGTQDLIVLATPDGAELASPVPAPQPYKAALGRLARLQRQHARQKRGSNRQNDTGERLARLHARIADLRADYIHKTTHAIAHGVRVLALPEMHIAARAQFQGERGWRKANQALYDAALGELLRQLQYKAQWAGTEVVMVPRSVWDADTEGLEGHALQLKRAINLAAYAASEVGASSGGAHARGAQVRPEHPRDAHGTGR